MSETPAAIPLLFFRSLQKKNYAQAWQCLSRYSQELIVQMLAGSWKAQSAEEIGQAFVQGQGPAKIYWDHFREAIELKTWLAQSYSALGASGSEVLVKASPADVTLLIKQESGAWKFGYMETFLERS